MGRALYRLSIIWREQIAFAALGIVSNEILHDKAFKDGIF